MESFTPLNQTRTSFKAHSAVPSSSKAASVPAGSRSAQRNGGGRIPYDEGEEYARVLSHERAARKHAEQLADSHAKSARVLEVSKTELVRKLLNMKIQMERTEREKALKQEEPSSIEVISDMKKQIEATSGELSDSNHQLAEESRKSAIAAQELMNMNKNLRNMEEELRKTKMKLTEAERAKFDVMIRTASFEKRVKSREALSENRLMSAEVQSANAQNMLDKLEEKIAYLDRRSTYASATSGTPTPSRRMPTTAEKKTTYLDENNAPGTSENTSSSVDPDRAAVLRKQALKNVDIVHDLEKTSRVEGSFAVPNMIEHDGDLHISEARTILVDPKKLDPTVGAHMDYLNFKALSSDRYKRNATDLDKASYVHQRQFASKKGEASPAIDQTVKDTHAAYAQFSKYKKFQTNDNISAAEKKLSALVNENHQLKISKEKSDLQCKASVEEAETLREKLRVTRLENEQYRSMSNNQEQDLIGWKVKTFEEIAQIDSNIRKIIESTQDSIEERAKNLVLSKLDLTEKKIRKLVACVDSLSRHCKEDKSVIDLKTRELADKNKIIEEQNKKMTKMEEEHVQHKTEVAESLAEAKKMKEEMEVVKSTIKLGFKKKINTFQMSSNEQLDSFQQKLNEISIKATRVFVEADKKTNAFDDLFGERGLEESLRSLESQLKACDDLNNALVSSTTASIQKLSSEYSESKQKEEKLAEQLRSEKEEKASLKAKAEECEMKAEASSKKLAVVQESFDKMKVETEAQLQDKEEKLQNTISEASHLLQEVDELTERIVEKEKEFVAVQKEAKAASKSKADIEKKLQKCQSSLESSEKELTSAKETVKSLESTVETKEKELTTTKEKLDAELFEINESLNVTKIKMEQVVIENSQLSGELEATTSKLTEAETSCEEASALIVELKQNHEKEKKEIVESLERENKELQDQVSKSTARVEELEVQVAEEKNELESFGDTIAAAEQQAEAAEAKSKEAEERVQASTVEVQQVKDELKELREQLSNAVSQKQAAEERTATAISKLYDMESRVEYEKKRAEGVVQVVSQQLNMEGKTQTAALISDFARLQQQLESEVNQTKRAELQERLDSLKLAMQYEEANSGSAKNNASFMQLENKLQTEREIRKKLEGELKDALDKCLANEEENQMLLKEYEEVVEENKFLVSQIENLSK